MQQAQLANWVLQQSGVALQSVSAVGGGCIHRAWRLELANGELLFAKTNQASLLPVLEAEADGLRALSAAAAPPLRIPEPLACAELNGEAVLLMRWLNLSPSSEPRPWAALGDGLARLHRASLVHADGRYGWPNDNFIGSGRQANRWSRSWARFFAEERLGRQLALAARSGHALAGSQALLEQVPHWLAQHPVEPCLVHGDLWSGNAGLLADGGAALFDPAVYRGDREVDLAMAKLFGGFPPAFFRGYEQAWPLPAGSERRVELYNLYHLLNHANLFGGSYWQQCAASIQRLLRSGV